MATEFIQRQVHLLHLEDNDKDVLLVEELLRSEGLVCEYKTVKTQADFESALRGHKFDLIVSDFSLPSYDGHQALALARKLCPEIPFIFFSGTIGEEVAVESLKNGATDYVLKQRPDRLVASIRSALRNAEERARRRRAEGELRQMEDRLRVVAAATNDVVWEWDLRTNHVWFSENFKIVFGHSPQDIGASRERWLDLIHPDDKSRVLSGLTNLLAGGGKKWWSEHRLRCANGSYTHVYDRASVVYDAARKPLRMVGVTLDETQRKQAEEKIHEQAALLDKAQDAIILCTPDGIILFWSQGARRIYGWTPEEVIGKNIRQLLFHNDNPAQLEGAVKSIREKGQWIGELYEFTKDNKTVIVQGRSTLICDEKKRPKSLLLINTDITERKQLEEKFLRAQRFESLGALVGGIAHDLNNALSPIIMGLEVLGEEMKSPENEGIFEAMETSARRSAEMVRQMLTFARGGEKDKVVIQVDHLVREMGKIIEQTFPKTITCRVRVDKSSWPVAGLPTQLYQVLMNLCVNARDAMPDGGTLTLATENVKLDSAQAGLLPEAKPGNYLCLSVADTGTGIPQEQLDKIFQPFFTTKAPGKGTGLGLSTCQSIVQNHDGFIVVRSGEKAGTEFKVYLPATDTAIKEPAARSESVIPTGHGEHVLVVDDELGVLALVRNALENYDYKVTTAESGPEAIARFARTPAAFALVITDFAMPLMDGRTTIKALRKIRPDVKIIVASGSEKEMDAARHQGKVGAYITKPFTTETLLKAVHDVLGQKA